MAERSWTDAQKNAIEAKSGTVLVSAAAGSGKTSVLVERIVRKLTAPENAVAPESLLVVTFTNAAAAEMRTRIYNSITKKMATEKDRRNEYILLLSRLGEMQICTMDSFCINLVRQNCHTLGIEADFRILSNAETEALKYSAVTKVCERRFRETPDTFDPLARMFDAGKNDSRLMKTIIKLSDFSMSEPEPEKWLDGIYLNFEPSDAAQSIWGRHIIEKINFAFDYCFALLNGAFRDISEDEELETALYDLYAVDRQVIETAFSVFKTENWDGKIAALEKASAGFTGKDRAFPRLKKGYSDNPYKKAAKEKRDAYKTVIQKMPAMMCCTDAENQEDTEILALIARELTEAVKEYKRMKMSHINFSLKKWFTREDFMDYGYILCEELVIRGEYYDAILLLEEIINMERSYQYFRLFFPEVMTFTLNILKRNIEGYMNDELALDVWERALDLGFSNKDDAFFLKKMAGIYSKLGDEATARICFEEANKLI